LADDDVGQRLGEGSLAVIRVGILQLQLLRDRRHLGRRGLEGDSVFKPGEAEKPVTLAAGALVMLGGPVLGGFGGREVKVARQNPDDGVGVAVQCDRATQNFGAAAVAFLPCGVTQDDGAGRRSGVLALGKIAAQNGSDSEHAEKARAHPGPGSELGPGRRGEHETVRVIDLELGEGFVELLEVVVVGE